MRKHIIVAAVMAVAALLSTATPAAADQPVARESFVEQDTFEDPFFAAACGVDSIVLSGEFQVDLTFYEDGTVRVRERVRGTVTNPDTGDEVTVTGVRNIVDQITVTEVDGFIVEEGTVVFRGMPEKWQAPGQGVLIRDAGRLELDIRVVIDPATGEVVSFEETVTDNGPHPLWYSGPFEAVCPSLGGAFVGFPDD